ncbi:MAG TPA: hypothetical protein VKU00_31170, partial [Chthonomonadaceae bacterium]|nr:hypothetical protein [Chthonomonadaceae bacterium]
SGVLEGSQSLTQTLPLDTNALPESTRLTVRITPSVSGALFNATDYLIGFPYGCTEQTMSRFLPDLLVQRAMRLNSLHDVKHAEELPKMVRNGLQRLYRFQHADTGGWGWWEHDKDDPWMTAYVLYGLSVAQAEGYPVSANALQKGRKAALKFLQEPDRVESSLPSTDSTGTIANNDRPFLLYALALTGDADDARAGCSKLKISGLSSQALGYLILLDHLLGEPSDEALTELGKRAVTADGTLHWKTGRWASWDWDDQTTNATVLRALLALNRQDPRIPEVLRWLMLQRTGDYWTSTRDTSWVLAAFCDFLTGQHEENSGGEVHITLNGKDWPVATLTPDITKEREILYKIPAANVRPGANTLVFQRTGGSNLVFVSVELRQTVGQEDIPALTRTVADLGLSPQHGLSPGPELHQPNKEDPNAKLEIKREYLRVLPRKVGSDAWSLQTEPTNNQLQEGDRVRVRLTLNVPREMAYVLIEDPFPSGCEVTERGAAEEVVEWGYWWDSVDIRDDKIAFFVRRLSAGQHVIEYNLRAMTHGSYHVLPTLLQGMYAPETRAESAESRVTVR